MTSPGVINMGVNVVGKEATTTGFNVGLPVGIDDVGFDVTGGDGATSALKQGPFWQPAPQYAPPSGADTSTSPHQPY